MDSYSYSYLLPIILIILSIYLLITDGTWTYPNNTGIVLLLVGIILFAGLYVYRPKNKVGPGIYDLKE